VDRVEVSTPGVFAPMSDPELRQRLKVAVRQLRLP